MQPSLSDSQADSLRALSRQVMAQLEEANVSLLNGDGKKLPNDNAPPPIPVPARRSTS